jgi:hypothetical protein
MSRFVKQTMGDSGSLRRSLRYSSVAWLVGLGACTSVLGIEDLHDGPRPGTGGDASTAGTSSPGAGTSSASGKNGTGGANGTSGSNASNGGSVNPDAGVGNEPMGGTADGGAGGVVEPVDGPLHGTVIDFWGKGLANIAVTVGEQTVATDKDGKFTTEPVPAEYDASLTVSRESGDKIYAWVYQGLTRRDPTLQVYQAREDRYTMGYVNVSDATLGVNDTISGSIGTADGSTEKTNLSTAAGGNHFAPDWQGPATTNGTIHALQWTVNQANDLPSSYKTYFSALMALSEGTTLAATTLKMAGPVDSGTITGTASPAGDGDRNNSVFVRFSSGGAIRLADHTPTADAFSYVVPTLANSSLSIAASEGDSYEAYGFVHKDGLSPGDAAGTLTIPAPATPLSPAASGDMADQTTPFTFNGSVDSKGAFVIHIEAVQFNQSFYIVTSKKKFTLPTSTGYSWIGGRVYYWRVETHGALATVDQMAGPTGFADPYYGPTQFTATGEPQGLNQASGSFTLSKRGFFTYNCVAGQVCVTP